MIGRGKSSRTLPCWIDAFEEQASQTGIPRAYVRWVAISAIAAALGRKVWSVNKIGVTYPNIFAMMIGPPGTGKTDATNLIKPMLRDLGENIMPDHVSKAAMVDYLANNEIIHTDKRTGHAISYHHCLIISSEFSVTFPGYDLHLMGTLSDWWDNPELTKERKRHLSEEIVIPKVCCNLLTGIQPEVLAHQFAPAMWRQGFLSRTLFIYEPTAPKLDILPTSKSEWKEWAGGVGITSSAYKDFIKDLSTISKASGELDYAEDYFDEDGFLGWYAGGEEPKPRHPRLRDYNTRRVRNLIKLTMISAISRGSMMMHKQDHFRALAWLEDVEKNLDDIFVEISGGDDEDIMHDLHSFIIRKAKGTKKPIRERELYRFLSGRIPTQRIASFLESMEKAEWIERVATMTPNVTMWQALPKDVELD